MSLRAALNVQPFCDKRGRVLSSERSIMKHRTAILAATLLATACSSHDDPSGWSGDGAVDRLNGPDGAPGGWGGGDAASEASDVEGKAPGIVDGSDDGTGGSRGGAAGEGGNAGSPPDVDGSTGGGRIHDASVVDSGDSASNGCLPQRTLLLREAVYLLFVLDGSKSMSHDNKWVGAIQALNGVFDEMKTAGDPGVGAGLIVFSDSNDPNTLSVAPYPSLVDVPIAYVDSAHRDQLVQRTADPDAPASNTPTGRALAGAYDSLAAYHPSVPLIPNGRKVVVLVTDGVPTDATCKLGAYDGTDDYAANGCVKLAASKLALAAQQGPIETFVVGIGPLPGDFATYDPYFLGSLAVAGGTAPTGCNPKSNSPPPPIVATSTSIPPGRTSRASEIDCKAPSRTFAIRSIPATWRSPAAGQLAFDPALVDVSLNDTVLAPGTVNGWSYDNPRNPMHIVLHGSSCSAVQRNRSIRIDMHLRCPTE